MKKNKPAILDKTIKSDSSNQSFNLICIITYFLTCLILVTFHEPWRDEAQAWLMARDLDLFSLFREMGYERSPALWHLILFPFAKLNAPYFSMSILHVIITTIAISIFIIHSPFSRITKVLFIFSYYIFFEYSMIARCYSLSILFLFLIAFFYPKRNKRLLLYSLFIFLLFNTNNIGFLAALVLTVIYIYESFINKIYKQKLYKLLLSLSIIFAGGIISFLQSKPYPDSMVPEFSFVDNWKSAFVAIGNAFIPSYDTNPAMTLTDKHWIVLIISTIILIYILFSFVNKTIPFIFSSITILGLLYVFVFSQMGFLRHHGFILIFLIFGLWISEYCKDSELTNKLFFKSLNLKTLIKIRIILLNIILGISVLIAVQTHLMDLNYYFSGSKKMAQYIETNKLDKYLIVSYTFHTSSAILPYLKGTRFWDPGTETYFTFVHWDQKFEQTRIMGIQTVLDKVSKNFPENKNYYIILPQLINNAGHYNLLLVMKTDKKVIGDEKYYLYLYKKPANNGV